MMAQRLGGVAAAWVSFGVDSIQGPERGEGNGRLGSVRILHQPFRADDAGREDAARRLGRAIGCAEDGEDDGACAAYGAEEGLCPRVSGMRCEGWQGETKARTA